MARTGRNVELASDDGLYPLIAGHHVKVHRTVHGAMVRDRDGIHAQFPRAADDFRDLAHSIQEAELAVNVKMSEAAGGGVRHRPDFRWCGDR